MSTPGTQRELTQQYKQTHRPAGVYAIRNRVNGRVYVSGGLDVQGAINRDRFELRLKGHRNARLQSDWTWFGEDAFTIDVVDTVRQSDRPGHDCRGELASMLDLWREELGSYGDTGYNARVAVAF